MVDSERILIRVNPSDIIFIDKTIESMGHLAMVTVLNGSEGLIHVTVTRSLKKELLTFFEHCGKEYQIIKEQGIES